VDPEAHEEQERQRPTRERWRRLPPRILPEEWREAEPASEPHESPTVLGNGVAYRGGVPLTD
jgi:hypothetical protein